MDCHEYAWFSVIRLRDGGYMSRMYPHSSARKAYIPHKRLSGKYILCMNLLWRCTWDIGHVFTREILPSNILIGSSSKADQRRYLCGFIALFINIHTVICFLNYSLILAYKLSTYILSHYIKPTLTLYLSKGTIIISGRGWTEDLRRGMKQIRKPGQINHT